MWKQRMEFPCRAASTAHETPSESAAQTASAAMRPAARANLPAGRTDASWSRPRSRSMARLPAAAATSDTMTTANTMPSE